MTFFPGFYEGIPFSEYLEDEAINSSGLKIFAQSPAKFIYWKNNQKPATPSQLEGSGLHCIVLQSELFEKSFGKKAAPRKSSAGRIEWEKDNPRAVALTPNQWENVHNMAESFKNTPCTIAKDLLTEGTPELSIWFDDPITGLRAKIRPDFLRDNDIVIDLKSTKDGSPKGFYWEMRKYGYDQQAYFYLHGINSAYRAAGVNRRADRFIFICVENVEPYLVSIYLATDAVLERGRQLTEKSLLGYKKCLDKNEWPGYENAVIPIEVPEKYLGEIIYD